MPKWKLKPAVFTACSFVLSLLSCAVPSLAAEIRVVQSGGKACLGVDPAAVSCLDPGLYAKASDLASLAVDPKSSKSEDAKRGLGRLLESGDCAMNAAMSKAAGGSVMVLRRSFKAKSKQADPLDRKFEDEVLATENVVSYKAPPKFKSLEFYTGASRVRACGQDR